MTYAAPRAVRASIIGSLLMWEAGRLGVFRRATGAARQGRMWRDADRRGAAETRASIWTHVAIGGFREDEGGV